ncbi:MAG: AzlC family ABC transporter permease [Clostridia bacterium]|nr:AzlC family ABC transporter permease [Clostridia bacterium]
MDKRIAKQAAFRAAFRVTVPVLWGYLAIGMTFGCMLYIQTGYGWPVAMVMSLLLYAGAMQFLAVPLIAQGAPLGQIALLTLLVNARHMVYGLSLFDTFGRCGKLGKLYAIFGLTDEAYALHTGVPPPPGADPGTFTLWVTVLCQSYWVIGGIIGNVIASLFEFDPRGIEFTLTALFLVILHGQWQQFRTKLPFVVGLGAGITAIVLVGSGNMLLVAVAMVVCLMIALRARLLATERENP